MKFSPHSGGPKGGKKFGGPTPWKRAAGGPGGDRSVLFPATCATCGKDCQVPFKPNGKKPVLCSNCFETNGPSESRPSYGAKRFEGSGAPSSSSDGAQLKIINAKLDAILELLNDL